MVNVNYFIFSIIKIAKAIISGEIFSVYVSTTDMHRLTFWRWNYFF